MEQFDYNTIKALASARGYRVPDLLALSPKNDPFYKGTPGDRANGAWFAAIYHRAGYSIYKAPHLRRVHYWIVSQEPAVLMPNGSAYENTERCWEFIIEASKAARYLELVPIDGIVDNKNPSPRVHAWYTDGEAEVTIQIPELDEPKIDISGIRIENAQPYHLEIWCEKSTMNDVLEPICQKYHANLVTFEGEVSITSVCVNLMRRIEESGYKPTRIWYISDFDPAGNSMPVAMSRKLEYALRNEGIETDVRVRPLALTVDQVKRYKLPRIPIKESEKRAGKFEAAFGGGAVELDALEALYAGQLAQIVDAALRPYYNIDAHNEVAENYQALRKVAADQVSAVFAKYKDQIAALRAMQDELRAIHVDASGYTVDLYEPGVEEFEEEWLFDSQREYIDQIVKYKEHKGIQSDL
jgi:hypothetical protein